VSLELEAVDSEMFRGIVVVNTTKIMRAASLAVSITVAVATSDDRVVNFIMISEDFFK
jgi:hypothetical protein